MINFVWSTVFARVREVGNPWRSLGLEWQIPSPPPPENFARVPVVLSGPYRYGFKDAAAGGGPEPAGRRDRRGVRQGRRRPEAEA